MPRNWTREQLDAIETRGRTLLVSAAAGSGKTTVLTERLIRLLTDPENPAEIERMLIVTFTRAAAAELRGRIARALGEALAAAPGNRHLHRQLLALESAKISTIHAYCLELIRANFQRLGLGAQFRVADEAEAGVLSRTLMDELIEQRYAADPAFGDFADHFTGARSDAPLAELFLSLYEQLCAYPEGVNFLRDEAARLADDPLSLTSGWGRVLRAQTERLYRDFAGQFAAVCAEMAEDAALTRAYLPAFSADLAHMREVLAALDAEGYSPLRAAVTGYAPARLGSLRGEAKSEYSEACRALRDAFKEARGALAERFFSLDGEGLIRAAGETAGAIGTLGGLLAEFDTRLLREKQRRGICDFSDIERYTLALLVDGQGGDSDIARDLAAQFDVICIDEYQDVNAVQDRIFRALARPGTRFMVGDIKQSIYRFRGAEPSIFADYRRRFPALADGGEGEAASIFMSSNFRCDRAVIDFCNRVFSFLFGHCGGSIGYLPADDLVCGKSPAAGAEPVPVTVALLAPEEDEADDAPSPEARYVAAEIARLLREGRLDDGSPVRAGDVAILLRAKTGAEDYRRALEAAGVPCERGGDGGFFANPEVLLMLCLLSAIDNPNRDVYLAGAMRSPLFGFTLDELIDVRRASPEPGEPLYNALLRYTEERDWAKGRAFLARLTEYRRMAEGTPVDRLLNALYRDTLILAYAGAEGDGGSPERKRANLHLLYEYARRFEASSYKGLYNFLRYLDDIIAEGTKIESPAPPAGDAVRILTIHQSKGLEFPVCFVCGAGRRHNLRDAAENLLFDHASGVAMRLRDESGFARRTTPMREAVAASLTEAQMEEEMRILYVALTRARERLYVTAQLRDAADDPLRRAAERRMFACPTLLLRCSSYLDWILTALSGGDGTAWQIVTPETTAIHRAQPVQPPQPLPEVDVAEMTETLRRRFDFVYPDAHLTRLPAKLAVSRLYPGLLDEDRLPADARVDRVIMPEMRMQPAFLGDGGEETVNAAERGTATHVFLQFCDFGGLARAHDAAAIKAEAARLVDARFISARMAALLRVEELSRFFASPLFSAITGAQWSLREQRFHLFLPAARFTDDPDYARALGDEQILVQGVIDLCFTTAAGELVLCDYKTDRLPADRGAAAALLRERYAGQLGYYCEACRALFGRLPDRVCLYAMALGEEIAL